MAPTPKHDLHVAGRRDRPREPITPAHCEVLSRAWTLVGMLEELNKDLQKTVRQSASRDMAAGAFAQAIAHVMIGAHMLVPVELDGPLGKLEDASV